MEKQTLTGTEAAEFLGLSRQRFYQLLKTYPLAPVEPAKGKTRRTWDKQALIAWRAAHLAEGAPTKEEQGLTPDERIGRGMPTRFKNFKTYIGLGARILATYPAENYSESWGAKARRWINEHGAGANVKDLQGVWDIGYCWGGWSDAGLTSGAHSSARAKLGPRSIWHYHSALDAKTSLLTVFRQLYWSININGWAYGERVEQIFSDVSEAFDVSSLTDDENVLAQIDSYFGESLVGELRAAAAVYSPSSEEWALVQIFLEDLEQVRASGERGVLEDVPAYMAEAYVPSRVPAPFRVRLVESGPGIALRFLVDDAQRAVNPEFFEALERVGDGKVFSVPAVDRDLLGINAEAAKYAVEEHLLNSLAGAAAGLGYRLVFSPVGRYDATHGRCVNDFGDIYEGSVSELPIKQFGDGNE